MIEVPVQHGGILQIRERSGHALQDSSEELWRDIMFLEVEAFSYMAVAQRKYVGEMRAVKDVLGNVQHPPKTLVNAGNVLLLQPQFRCL